MKISPKKIALITILLAAVIGGGGYKYMHRGEVHTDDAAIESSVLSIRPKVGGYIKTLSITDNQHIKAGDVLLEIDPTDYAIAVDRAKASLEAAEAKLNGSSESLETTKISAPSNLEAAQAQVAVAQANWENANTTMKRLKSLSDLARSRQQLDDAVAAERAAFSTLSDVKAKLRSAETAPKTVALAQSNMDELAAAVKGAKADLAQAEKNLADTKIIASMDGRVTNRGIEQGDYIQPGQQLFSIVGDDFWIVANFKEIQLTDMKAGQRVDIHVDAFPDMKLTGTVNSIQAGTGSRFSAFPAQNATGNFVKIVQRVPVKITLDAPVGPDVAIGPGMSVVPTVHTR